MNYQVIFLDIDNTLLDFEQAEICAFQKTIEQIDYVYSEKVFKIYNEINNRLWQDLELGKMNVTTLKVKRFEELVHALGIDCSGEALSKLYEKHLGEGGFEIEGAYETCQALSKKYELAIITNGIANVQRSRIAQSSFASFIKKIFISEEIGISKPDAGIFEYALREMHISDKRLALMVGDSPTSDMKGSQNAGIDSCFFNPKGINLTQIDQTIRPTYEIRKLTDLIKLLE